MPDLVQVAKRFSSKGGDLLLISYDLQLPSAKAETVIPKVEAFLSKRGFAGDCLILAPAAIPQFEEFFALDGVIPATLALSSAGKVLARHEKAGGVQDFEALVAAIEQK